MHDRLLYRGDIGGIKPQLKKGVGWGGGGSGIRSRGIVVGKLSFLQF